MIVMNDSLIADKETNKLDEHERSATLEVDAIIPDSLDDDTANDISKEHSAEVSTKQSNKTGTNFEAQNFGGEASAVEETSSSSSGGKTKSRKRLREKVEEDEDDDDAMNENAGEDAPDVIDPPAREEEENDEDMRDLAAIELPSASPSTNTPTSDSDTDDDDDNLENLEDMFFNRDFFLTRTFGANRKNRKDLEKKKKVDDDVTTKFHLNVLKLSRQREMGYPPRKLNGYLAYQEAVVRDPDVVKRFGLVSNYEEHTGCVNCLHFNEAGNLIASGSDDMSVVIYDWTREKVSTSFATHHKENIFQTKFMPHSNDSHIATCARDGVVRIAQLSTTGSCSCHKKLATHKGAAHKLALIQDSAHEFYSCAEDGVTFQIDLRIGKPSMSFMTKRDGKKVSLYSVHANPMKSYEICVVGRDPYVRIYDVRNIKKNSKGEMSMKKFCPENLNDGYDHITAAVYNYNGTEIIASYNDDDIYLFNSTYSDEATHLKRYEGHKNSATVKGVNFYGAKSEYVVSGSDCGNVFIWDKESTELVNVFHADDAGVVNVIENHPTLPLIATSGLDNDVKLWSPNDSPVSDLEKFNLERKSNKRSRPKNRIYAEFDDSRLLWFLMRTLRRGAEEAGSSSESSSDLAMVTDDDDEEENNNDNDDNDPNEDDGTGRQNIQCASS